MFYQTPDDGSADRTGNQLCYTTITMFTSTFDTFFNGRLRLRAFIILHFHGGTVPKSLLVISDQWPQLHFALCIICSPACEESCTRCGPSSGLVAVYSTRLCFGSMCFFRPTDFTLVETAPSYLRIRPWLYFLICIINNRLTLSLQKHHQENRQQ